MAAGLVAYFMGQGKSAADARRHLYDKAYVRNPKTSAKVIWNDVDTRQLSGNQAPANPPPAAPRYVEGTCSIHVNQTRTGVKRGSRNNYQFALEVSVHDQKDEIGRVGESKANPTLGVTSRLEHVVLVTQTGTEGSLEFAYAAQKWKEDAQGTQLPNCKRGGWDMIESGRKAKRQMDCWFECKH